MELPFRLPYIYIMNGDAIDDELLNPANLKDNLLALGLRKTELDLKEYLLADSYASKYKKLSKHDRVALAIAKHRNIILLTGDKRLREAAKKESVVVIGTLTILDNLYELECITEKEYDECLNALKKYNGKNIRLPQDEIDKRLTDKYKLNLNKGEYQKV